VTARRVTSIVILMAFLALAVLAVLGNPALGAIFIVVAGAVLIRNASRLCPKCSNLACAFNPRASKSGTVACDRPGGFSDLPITKTTVVPLLLAGPLAFIGAWQYNPFAAVAVGAVAFIAHEVFSRLTCSRCGNDCAGNRNPLYRQWKTQRRSGGA
jgi:ribosomal protein S27AE